MGDDFQSRIENINQQLEIKKKELEQQKLNFEQSHRENELLKERYSFAEMSRLKTSEEQELNMLYFDEQEQFGHLNETSCLNICKIQEELTKGPEEGLSKVEKQEWIQTKQEQLQVEQQAFEAVKEKVIARSTRRFEYESKLNEIDYETAEISKYKDLLLEELKNGSFKSTIEQLRTANFNNKEMAPRLFEFLDVLLSENITADSEKIERMVVACKEYGLCEGGIADEQLDTKGNIPTDAKWIFMLTGAVRTLSMLVNGSKAAGISEELIAEVNFLRDATGRTANKVYISGKYSDCISEVLSEKQALEESNRTVIEETNEEITNLEKEKKRLEEEYKAKLFKEIEEARIKQEEEAKRLEEEKEAQRAQKQALEDLRTANFNRNTQDTQYKEELIKLCDKELKKNNDITIKEVNIKFFYQHVFQNLNLGDDEKKAIPVLLKEYAVLERENEESEKEANKRREARNEIRKEVLGARKAGLEKKEKFFATNASVDAALINGVTPLMASYRKEAPNYNQTIKFNKAEQLTNTIDKLYPSLNGIVRDVLIQIALVDEEYSKLLGKKNFNPEEDKRYLVISSCYEKIEERLTEKAKNNQDILVSKSKDEVLYLFLAQLKTKSLVEVDPSQIDKEITAIIKEYDNRSLKKNKLYEYAEKIAEYPLLSQMYYEAKKICDYEFYNSGISNFNAVVNHRVQFIENSIKILDVFEKLAPGERQLHAGLLDYFMKDINITKEVDVKAIEEKASTILKSDDYKEYLKNPFEEMKGYDKDSIRESELTALGAITREEFNDRLKVVFEKNKYKCRALSAEETTLIGIVLSFPELIGASTYIPGMNMVVSTSESSSKIVEAREAIKTFVKNKAEHIDYQVNYKYALESLTKTKGEETLLNSKLFEDALSFAEAIMKNHEQAISKEKFLEEMKTEAFQKKHAEAAAKARAALSVDGIKESKNEKAIAILDRFEKGQKEYTEDNFKTLLVEQARSDKMEDVLAGFLSISKDPLKLNLFYRAIERRDCLDISKENINKNRLGLADRTYENEIDRAALVDDYILKQSGEYEIKNVIRGVLSSRIDETKKEDSQGKYRTRSTALDWKLIGRAIQLVYRSENERELFAAQNLLADKTQDELELDSTHLRENLHNSGFRLTRYFMSHLIKNKLYVSEGVELAYQKLFVEDDTPFTKEFDKLNIVDQLNSYKKLDLKKQARNFENLKLKELCGNIKEIIETVPKIDELVKDFKKCKALSQEASASAVKAQKTSDELIKANAEMEQATELNANLMALAKGSTKERNIDSIVVNMSEIIGAPVGMINDTASLAVKIAQEGVKLVNILRSYISESKHVDEFFKVKETASTMSDELKNVDVIVDTSKMSESKMQTFVRKATGFEKFTEMSDVVGINMVQSILFSASRYNDKQPVQKYWANLILQTLGKEKLRDNISYDASKELFDALMGEYR